MSTNLTELPQAKGAIVAISQAKQYPEGSLQQKKLTEMGFVGVAVAASFVKETHAGNFPQQGRVGSRRNKQKIDPAERVDEIAQNMLKAGRSPQEIGAEIARLLGWKD